MKIADIRDAAIVQKAATARPADAATAVDRINSSGAQNVAAAVQLSQAASMGSRAARISQLTAAVRGGGYNPNPEAIADQIMDAAQIDATLRSLLK